jgi:hypothetical protein
MGEAVASTDWKWFLTYVERVRQVTADDVKRVAATYLVPDHATVGWFVPTASAKSAAATSTPTSTSTPTRIPASVAKIAAAPAVVPPSDAQIEQRQQQQCDDAHRRIAVDGRLQCGIRRRLAGQHPDADQDRPEHDRDPDAMADEPRTADAWSIGLLAQCRFGLLRSQ